MIGESVVLEKEPISWEEQERSLGLHLPQDYKALVSKYFTVNLGPISVVTPRAGTPGEPDLFAATRDSEVIFRDFFIDDPDEIADPMRQDGSPLESYSEVFDFYPKLPGLLKWGMDYLGGSYYWYVDGPPEGWAIVAQANEGWWDEHRMPMSEYLYGIVTRSLECDVAPKLFNEDRIFVEWPWPTPGETA
ncbi:hypothetical protein [Nocardiopsis sp. FIRDI 009]|uniref:hypothetical protein n=1 Tax=Nocardiopsis sp. FIRDI 009 TaxID=714197 RepID=UPI0013006BC7|nr:hypothetical protein [Nocardiopsis sp. FIRDI 009]